MNTVELFLLSRKLMQLAESGLPAGNLATSVRLVLLDVAAHPASSISEITSRTGFLQSHVSGSVATLRELGAVTTETDPLDRRRTLVRVTPQAMDRGRRARSLPIEIVLAPVLEEAPDEEVAEVVDALELLARRLVPSALSQLRTEVLS